MTDIHKEVQTQEDLVNNLTAKMESDGRIIERLDAAINKGIEEYLDSLNLEEHHSEFMSQNALITPAMKRLRLKKELEESAKLTELGKYIESSFEILYSEGPKYLNKKDAKTMNSDLVKASAFLDILDLSSPPSDNFQTLLHFSDSTIESIFAIAVGKFNQKLYLDSLSLFVLLSTLIPETPDYWYRAGMVAQKCDKLELAIKLYATAIELDPRHIGAWLFSTACYLERDLQPEALSAFGEAKKIAETLQKDDPWQKFIVELKEKLEE